jgi:NDP-sugar pyrophosphorylase family protein
MKFERRVRMKFAIIAAGEGSRLTADGVRVPKPLVKVGGEHLIDRLIRVFVENDAEEIDVICNDLTPLVSAHLQHISENGLNGRPVPLRFIVKSTPSSMHSFYELSSLLGNNPFVLTTVDTIFREHDFSVYINAFEKVLAEGGDGLMGVTDFVDDEKPLYVGTDEEMNITGFYDDNSLACNYISGGIYGLAPSALQTLNSCMQRGESRMRNFQRGLIRDGRRLKAFRFSKVLDIDHASDIAKAEAFLGDEVLLDNTK